jgi:LmbE family N-acetylglucosaminyl deacetylase
MPSAIAIAAHPDDIEFVMAGTLLLLKQAGWDIHYFNLSTGNVGSMTMTAAKTAQVRRREAQAAAKVLGAAWYAPICNDIEIFYEPKTLQRVGAVIRAVDPEIVLTHSPEDYMEDHMNTARLAVTAAFVRGMPNYRTLPSRPPVPSHVAVYHANPHGLCDGLRRPVIPGLFVDTTSVHAQKREALARHSSQKEWLDATQGMDSYLVAMDEFATTVGRMAPRKVRSAEGWRRHSHLGFSPEGFDPLAQALGKLCQDNERPARGKKRK